MTCFGNCIEDSNIHNFNKALFYSKKVLIFFLLLHKNVCCGYLLEVPEAMFEVLKRRHNFISTSPTEKK